MGCNYGIIRVATRNWIAVKEKVVKSHFWTIVGLFMLITMALSALYALANEFNLVVGSPGVFLNPIAHINTYRVFCVAVIFLSLSILNVSKTGKLK